MTPQQIELVKSTVPVLREHGVTLTSYFYHRMLNNHPELKNVFNLDHQTTGRQPRALAAAVLAYAEFIETPEKLAKAVEHITNKHVSLNIQPEQYAIVGENLLHSISEVLNVPFESDLIEAWKQAYLKLADILIGVEQQKYDQLAAQNGGWAGWRNFKIVSIEQQPEGKFFIISAADQQLIPVAKSGEYISVKVHVPAKGIDQPQQFIFSSVQDTAQQYGFLVKSQPEHSEYDVANILLTHYRVGDELAVSAPLKG
ncbi:globin domain-containing protein [Acinetobacter ihumii]|uniref:globin domain-containing protein n=1 Tax=Acinetobacter ihumii TaxID=2483802 RepID=UPI0010301746|nr:globin domain-containing protein [Acinetobacter ihumii]